MAQFVFEIPDAEAARIAVAVCAADGYGPTSAADATEHTKQHVFRYLARVVIEQEANAAAVAAADLVRGNANDPLAAALFAPVVPPAPDPQPGPDGGGGGQGETGATGATGN